MVTGIIEKVQTVFHSKNTAREFARKAMLEVASIEDISDSDDFLTMTK